MNSNRLDTYKTLQRYYQNKAKGKQKGRVADLLTLYMDGKIFSKITAQREINRYLGRFKTEGERDMYYFQTIGKHMTNIRTKTLNTRQNKLEPSLDKLSDINAILLIKDEHLTASKNKAFSTVHIKLNTKPAFKKMPDEERKEITGQEYNLWAGVNQLDEEGKPIERPPRRDTVFHNLEARIERIIRNNLRGIDGMNRSAKIALSQYIKLMLCSTNMMMNLNICTSKKGSFQERKLSNWLEVILTTASNS